MKFSAQSVQLEHAFAACIDRQMRHGILFDVEKAQDLYCTLDRRRAEIDQAVTEVFPATFTDTYFTPKKKLERTKETPFNIQSRAHLVRVFKERYGWEPKHFTPDGRPQLDERVLGTLEFPEAALLAERMMLMKLIGMVAEGNSAWLKLVDDDDRIRGYVNHNGTITGRCTHSRPNLGQIPSLRKPYGRECRELFRVPEGFKMVGYDLSGLELRCLAHYLYPYDEGAYADTILNGDIHTANQKAAGLETRDQAKTFIYAFLYGAGGARLGEVVGGSRKEGLALRKRFLAATPALAKLILQVKASAKRGYLKGLDGRLVSVRSEHSALNTLLQSAGAVCMKQVTVAVAERPAFELGNMAQVAHCHDEAQLEVVEDMAQNMAEHIPAVIAQAGEELGFRMPLEGEAKVGNNWAETH